MTTPGDVRFESCDMGTLRTGLPSELYFDQEAYTAELRKIWCRQWLYVCRGDSLAQPGDYRVFQIGTQRVLIVRAGDASLHAFHNTCVHRGSMLCEGDSGHLAGKRIVCPYHRWTYALSGELISVPFLDTGGSEKGRGLYKVALRQWGGNVLINLDVDSALEPGSGADPGLHVLANWPLADLRVVHTHEYKLACNWKIFWENFVECYHCPGTHPGLCRLVPLYQQTFTSLNERLAAAGVSDGVAAGVESWTMDGRAHGPTFPGLTTRERETGYTFLTLLPTMFIVAHRDYVRQVSIVPLGPEQTAVRSEWLFSDAAIGTPGFDARPAVDFVTRLLLEDARVCELNQRGLRAVPHAHGSLVPQEEEVFRFQEWYRACMGKAGS